MPNPEALLPLGGELYEVLGEDPLSHFHRFHHHIDGLAGQFSDDIFPRFLPTPVSSHHDSQYFPNRTTNSQDKFVATAQDGRTVKLGEDERPYLAFVRSGMSIDEAKAAAKQIEKATGRTSFNQGEQLSIHSDGSVSAKTEQRGNSVETTYGARGGRERAVEQNKDGSTKETDFDNGTRTKTIETKPASGDRPAYRTETTWGPHGKPLISVETQGDANGAHQQITTDFTARTTTRKDVAADGSSVTTTNQGNGTTSVEKRVGKVTNTRDTNPNGYVDSSFDPTVGNPSMTVRPTNGQVGAWMDPIDPWSYTW